MTTVVDLTATDHDWRDTRIPGSDRDVRLVRLHADVVSGASVSLVEFPVGWRRPGTGHYTCAEEFVVLRGAITVSGQAYARDHYAFLPPGARRTDSATPQGCLAVAYFSGPPRWIPDDPVGEADGSGEDTSTSPPAERIQVRHGPAERASRGHDDPVPGSATTLAQPPPGKMDSDTDVLSLPTGRWAFAPAGAGVPDLPGPLLLRRWASTNRPPLDASPSLT